MRLFDTRVQEIKYEVLKEIARLAFEDKLAEGIIDIPQKIITGPKANMRCCIYKERAIIGDRIKLALGGDKSNENIIELLPIACDECPVDKYKVSEACRGCITHRCKDSCPVDAITIINKKAYINQEKCIECGKCCKACPYGAIVENIRPCVRSCKVGAINIDADKKAKIDNSKCIMCGACVYQCPFGAISDKSYILDAIDIIKKSDNNKNYKVYAIIAPAIVSQFRYAKIGQVVSGIKHLGFHQVVEAALGADITLYKEAAELEEKGKLTTSCCPSFVMYIEKAFPALKKYVSHNLSPMMETAQLIKRSDKNAKVIFIGPCTSKKHEYKRPEFKGIIDCVITFEELQALFDSKNLDIEHMAEDVLDNASYYGRIFAKSGGVSQGVAAVMEKRGKKVKTLAMNGIAECKVNLFKLSKNLAEEDFFEGMACEGGCINGGACLHHGPKNLLEVDKYGKSAKEKDIDNSVNLYLLDKNNNNM